MNDKYIERGILITRDVSLCVVNPQRESVI